MSWFIAWLMLVLWSWLVLLTPRPEGQLINPGNPLPIYLTSATYGLATLKGIGPWSFIAASPRLLSFSKDESDAVLWHEAGHYVHHHTIKRLLIGNVYSGALFIVGANADPMLWFPAIVAWWYLGVLAVGLIWRGHEYEADEWAAARCDATALIGAILRVTADPMKRGPFHPSLAQRAKALGIDLSAIMRAQGRLR